MRKRKKEIAEVVEAATVEIKERKQAPAHELIRRILVDNFLFQPIAAHRSSFGERVVLRATEANLEAQLGAYRVCFYFDEAGENGKLPTKRAPLCFDTKQRSNVREFLEKILGKPASKKTRVRAKQNELFSGK